MARTKLRVVVDEATGTPFYFGYDRADPQRLHVEVRGHSIQAAIETYFNASTTVWNSDNRRWEREAGPVRIYWTYLNNEPGPSFPVSTWRRSEHAKKDCRQGRHRY